VSLFVVSFCILRLIPGWVWRRGWDDIGDKMSCDYVAVKIKAVVLQAEEKDR
jgi:hypothetical protein